jgi:uncharacterized protein
LFVGITLASIRWITPDPPQAEIRSRLRTRIIPLITRKIAVIGSGISGLSAAWLLSKRHRVTLIEAENRPGGHSHTVDCDIAGRDVAVDTGFIVYNPQAYPNLTALFTHLRVPTAPSDMSFSVSMDDGAYEYAGTTLTQLVGTASNLFRPAHWRMVADIGRFFRTASSRLGMLPEHLTIGEFVKQEGYSDYFVHRHLLPMGGAIWSASPDAMLQYPAAAFLRFFANHGLLQVSSRPQWRTVKGGSREYVSRLMLDSSFDTILRTPVKTITRNPNGVAVRGADGSQQVFDDVVIATHADQALAMLADPSPEERRLLSGFRYSRNRAVLHSDASLMPRRRRLWSSWNYLSPPGNAGRDTAAVTYWMNRLQPLSTGRNIFVSLNPHREPAGGDLLGEFDYEHPVFDPAAMSAQRQVWTLQGRRNTWFCGAYFGSGFHEDGIQSGLAVAEELGGLRRPWTVADESGRIHLSRHAALGAAAAVSAD